MNNLGLTTIMTNSTDKTPSALLNELRKKLHNKEMSVMVGAGFSMNVSRLFPTWDALLYDLVYELYGHEIEKSFRSRKRRQKKQEYIRQEIRRYLKVIGSLEIVSQYIIRKGTREAITTYIEERIPRVENNKLIVSKPQKSEELRPDSLSLHRLLLDLPWNNIYTTNYDTLLEDSINQTASTDLNEELYRVDQEIQSLRKKRASLILEPYRSTGLAKPHKRKRQSWSQYQNHLPSKTISQKNEINQLESSIKKLEKSKDQIKAALLDTITVVKEASLLSAKKNRNIIKLHGSLRKEGDRTEFDGDIHKQYVIAKEDYESYPEKHEAFTQLMRISLLQEAYCLIGFSGDDPNFIE